MLIPVWISMDPAARKRCVAADGVCARNRCDIRGVTHGWEVVNHLRRGEAELARRQRGRRTILFVDEIHRFNKAQQDALLPHVENGTIILIGATTENPYFEVIGPLVSRSRVFQLKPLSDDNVRELIQRTLMDVERGYGGLLIDLDDDALEHLIHVAGGDARNALNALELAVESTVPDAEQHIHITSEVAQESIQRRAILYDKDGDAHYDTISAFIKSVRGSDPDAALYWLAKMLYAGEDPRFILRRLLILAGEDIGLADPLGLVVANAAAQASRYEGMYGHLVTATSLEETAFLVANLSAAAGSEYWLGGYQPGSDRLSRFFDLPHFRLGAPVRPDRTICPRSYPIAVKISPLVYFFKIKPHCCLLFNVI